MTATLIDKTLVGGVWTDTHARVTNNTGTLIASTERTSRSSLIADIYTLVVSSVVGSVGTITINTANSTNPYDGKVITGVTISGGSNPNIVPGIDITFGTSPANGWTSTIEAGTNFGLVTSGVTDAIRHKVTNDYGDLTDIKVRVMPNATFLPVIGSGVLSFMLYGMASGGIEKRNSSGQLAPYNLTASGVAGVGPAKTLNLSVDGVVVPANYIRNIITDTLISGTGIAVDVPLRFEAGPLTGMYFFLSEDVVNGDKGNIVISRNQHIEIAPDVAGVAGDFGRTDITIGDVDDGGEFFYWSRVNAFDTSNTASNPNIANVTFSADDSGDPVYEQASQTVNIVSGDKLQVLADVLAASVAGPTMGSFASKEITARLIVNGAIVPITSFNFQAPTGKLGSILNVRLGTKSISGIPNGSTVDFYLVVGGYTSTESLVPLMKGGKLSGRATITSWQGGKNAQATDEVTFSAMDILADKFTLSPRRPVIMFDPRRVKYDEINTRDVKSALRDDIGQIILPLLEPVYGLSLHQVMNRAYTPVGGFIFVGGYEPSPKWNPGMLASEANNQIGMDFTNVITNIEDYPVRRADFPVESSWNDGVRPFTEMYAPMSFVHNHILFIMDTDKALSYSTGVHQLTLGDHKKLSETQEFKNDTNAVILTYQYAANDPAEGGGIIVVEDFTEEEDEQGTFGGFDYVKTVTQRWDYKYYDPDHMADPIEILPKSVTTTTYQAVGWYIDGVMTLLNPMAETHKETIYYTYEGTLKVHHQRNVFATIPIPSGGDLIYLYEQVISEECRIQWQDDPKEHGSKIQAWSKTTVQGICYISDTDKDVTYGGSPITIRHLFPAVEFAESGNVVPEMGLTSLLQPIRTESENLRNVNGNQFEVERIEIDHLTNTVRKSWVDTRTGSVNSNPYETRTRNVLLRDLESEALIGYRTPIGVNAYEVPRVQARELGERILKRLSNPAQTLPIDLPGVDFVIARGTVIKGQRRNETFTNNFIVTGYSINGDSLGKQGHRIYQNLEAIELLTS
jgi:hypothetical protein